MKILKIEEENLHIFRKIVTYDKIKCQEKTGVHSLSLSFSLSVSGKYILGKTIGGSQIDPTAFLG